MKALYSILLIAAASLAPKTTAANIDQNQFDKVFNDSTLRVDFVLSGNSNSALVSLHNVEKSGEWWGRRVNLKEVPVQGNAQIIMTDKENGDTLYILPFSTLFQEWLSTEEAQTTTRSMEGTMLLPLPKMPVDIEIVLFDKLRNKSASSTFVYDPDDVNVRISNIKTTADHEFLWKGGDSKNVIDVVILGEGYSSEDLPMFRQHAETAVESIFNHEPFKSRKNDFNFIIVNTPSTASGVSVPQDGRWIDSAFGSHYNTFYSPRYLTTTHTDKIHDVLRGIPYEHIIILANEDVYGGGGIFNFYTLTTSKNKEFQPVVVHEFGHSFGGLADEYFYEGGDVLDEIYSLDVEPWELNISTLKDDKNKWVGKLGELFNGENINMSLRNDGVGVFEGGGYQTKGIYRPVDRECRMRFNTADGFCPVCSESISYMIDFYTKER